MFSTIEKLKYSIDLLFVMTKKMIIELSPSQIWELINLLIEVQRNMVEYGDIDNERVLYLDEIKNELWSCLE